VCEGAQRRNDEIGHVGAQTALGDVHHGTLGRVEHRPLGDFVDTAALIASAHDDALATIPLPALNVSPAPEVGGVVNLGLWLAADDPGQINASASVGPVWASVPPASWA